jgi:DMSO reductase anchor subunit
MSSETSAQQPGAVDPGYTTTEFWQTLFVNLVAAGVAIGSLFSNNFNLNGVNAVVPSVAVVAAAISQAYYNHSRAQVKATAQSASAQVEAAKATTQAQTAVAALPPASTNPERSMTISFSDALGNALVRPTQTVR